MDSVANANEAIPDEVINNKEPESTETPTQVQDDGLFTSEIFKIEIQNLPKVVGFAQIKKFIASKDLKAIKVKQPPGNCSFAFVTFGSEEEREKALKVLNNAVFKGRTLQAFYAKASQDPVLKRKNENNNHPNKSLKKEAPEDDGKSPEEKVRNATEPLWNMAYEKQCDQKKGHMKQVLRKTFYKMERQNKDTFYWLHKQSKENEGMCCSLEEFVQSPVLESYRNKCEFTIGYDSTETVSKIGFRVGDYKSGTNEVVHPYGCCIIPDIMKEFVRHFHPYLDESIYKPCNVRLKTGNWRQLTVRSNEAKEILVIATFDQANLTDEEVQREKNQLIAFLTKTFGDESKEQSFRLKSFLFNLNTNRSGFSNSMTNLELIYGENYLNERLLGLDFRVSPLAFFQCNTKAAELLYSKIGDICDLDKDTILLDICCGTGTIGLTLANKAKLVVGVEIIPEAIEDAKLNASLNNVTNVEFHCGKAEDVLPDILRRFQNEKVVAIVDPPRAGLHTKVIKSLRQLNNLENLIYVSCNAELAMENFVDLSRDTSKRFVNKPFVPIRSIAVDMFPHTNHCELILYFTRYSNELMKAPTRQVTAVDADSTAIDSNVAVK